MGAHASCPRRFDAGVIFEFSLTIVASVGGRYKSVRKETMKTTGFIALLFASTLTAGAAFAQPVPFNETGVTMGHWHIISKDVEANKKLFLGMGGKLLMPGGNPLMMFPGLYINLNLGTETGNGGSQGSVVNHVGFIVDNVQQRVAQWKAAGVPVLPGNNNRLDQAFVETPDGVRIEILEDKTQSMPIRNEHVHFFLPENEIGGLGHPHRDHRTRARWSSGAIGETNRLASRPSSTLSIFKGRAARPNSTEASTKACRGGRNRRSKSR